MGKMIIAVILAATVLAAPFILVSQTITQEIVAPSRPGGGGGGGVSHDRTPPRIYNVSLCDIGETTADICWTTNEWSTSQVKYWTSPSKLSPLDETRRIQHRVQLTDLTPGTTYHYKMMSEDKSGNLRVSDEHSFTTQGEAPAKPAPPEPEKPEPVVPEPTPPPAPEPAPPPPPPPPEEPTPWLLIGGLIGAAAIVAGGIVYWRRRK
ncbi:hypothetical protein ES703_58783 [subsurface metagenome]